MDDVRHRFAGVDTCETCGEAKAAPVHDTAYSWVDLSRVGEPPDMPRGAVSLSPAVHQLAYYRHAWQYGGVNFVTEYATTSFATPDGANVTIRVHALRRPRKRTVPDTRQSPEFSVAVNGQWVDVATNVGAVDHTSRELVAFGLGAMNWLAGEIAALEQERAMKLERRREKAAAKRRRMPEPL